MLKTIKKIQIPVNETNRIGLGKVKSKNENIYAEITEIGFLINREGDIYLNASGKYFYIENQQKVYLSTLTLNLEKDVFRAYFQKFSETKSEVDERLFEMLYYLAKDIMVEDSEGDLTADDIEIIDGSKLKINK